MLKMLIAFLAIGLAVNSAYATATLWQSPYFAQQEKECNKGNYKSCHELAFRYETADEIFGGDKKKAAESQNSLG